MYDFDFQNLKMERSVKDYQRKVFKETLLAPRSDRVIDETSPVFEF